MIHPSGQAVVKSGLPPDLSRCTKSEISSYFENAYDLYDTLFSSLTEESTFYKSPDRLRLPLIFYFGHTAAFYINKLVLVDVIKEHVDLHLETLFETGVDERNWDDVANYRLGGAFSWPMVCEVMEYRSKVRRVVLDVIKSQPLKLPITIRDDRWWALLMCIEHDRIHFETTAVLIRQLPVELVQAPLGWKNAPTTSGVPAIPNPLIVVPETQVTIGKPEHDPSYGWDIEYGHHRVRVTSFEASKFLITNGEFLEFVVAGGYGCQQLWNKEGWEWCQYRHTKHPPFWVCDAKCTSGCGGELAVYSHCHLSKEAGPIAHGYDKPYKYRAMFEVMDLPMDWPVEITYHEAKAFCSWKGAGFRLTTEAEHNALRDMQESLDVAFERDPSFNINMQYGSSTPVNLFPPNALGFHDVCGNLWQWMEDHVNGLEGFKPHFLYPDYTTTSCDGRHHVLLGGTWSSTGVYSSQFSRNFFRRHFFQFSGFRVARNLHESPPIRLVRRDNWMCVDTDEENEKESSQLSEGAEWTQSVDLGAVREREEILHREMWLNYGEQNRDDGVQMRPSPFAQICLESARKHGCATKRALHVLCSVGRLSFELAGTFQEVTGVDCSRRLVQTAVSLHKGDTVEYPCRNNNCGMSFTLPLNINQNKITFKQLAWLPQELGKFDMLVLSSLEEINCPKGLTARLWEMVNPGGLVIIQPAEDWSEQVLTDMLMNKFRLLERTFHGKSRICAYVFCLKE